MTYSIATGSAVVVVRIGIDTLALAELLTWGGSLRPTDIAGALPMSSLRCTVFAGVGEVC